MESLREQQEELEERILSPYAAKSAESRGRDRKEEPCEIRRSISGTATAYCTVKRFEG